MSGYTSAEVVQRLEEAIAQNREVLRENPGLAGTVKLARSHLRLTNPDPDGSKVTASQDAREMQKAVKAAKTLFDAKNAIPRDERLAAEAETLRIRQEAERIAAQDVFTPSLVMDWEALREYAEQVPDHFLEDWLPARGLAVLGGRSNIGKSFVSLDIALCAAAGLDWHGYATKHGAKTLFIIGEGTDDLYFRMRTWCVAHGIDQKDVLPNIKVIAYGSISNDTYLEQWREVIEDFRPDMVVYDTYSALSGVVDEDKAGANANVLDRIRELAPDSLSLIVHHVRKSDEEAARPSLRGSGVFYNNTDAVMMLTRVKEERKSKDDDDFGDSELSKYLVLSTDQEYGGKAKGMKPITATGFYLTDCREEYGTPRASVYLAKTGAKVGTRIPKFLKDCIKYFPMGKVMTAMEYAEAAGKSHSTAYDHIAKAVAADLLMFDSKKDGHDAYRLSGNGMLA